MTHPDFKIQEFGIGTAEPVFTHQLLPEGFDHATNATGLRAAWLLANSEGAEINRARREAEKTYRAEHQEDTFADRGAWNDAVNIAMRGLDADLRKATRRSVAALKALADCQWTHSAEAAAVALDLLLDSDNRARKAMTALEVALADRTAAARVARVRTDGHTTHPRFKGVGLDFNALIGDVRLIVERALVFDGKSPLDAVRAKRTAKAAK